MHSRDMGECEVSERREREISRWVKVVQNKPKFSSVLQERHSAALMKRGDAGGRTTHTTHVCMSERQNNDGLLTTSLTRAMGFFLRRSGMLSIPYRLDSPLDTAENS